MEAHQVQIHDLERVQNQQHHKLEQQQEAQRFNKEHRSKQQQETKQLNKQLQAVLQRLEAAEQQIQEQQGS